MFVPLRVSEELNRQTELCFIVLIVHYPLDSEHKWSSPLLLFVIARIGLSVQNTNLPSFISREVWIRGKVKCNKIPNLKNDQN